MIAAGEVLSALLIGGVMGMVGQGARVAVGLKKLNDQRAIDPSEADIFSAARLVVSLAIGFIAGVIAAISSGLNSLMTADMLNVQLLLGLAAAGYAGTDVIEAFLGRINSGGAATAGAGGGGGPAGAGVEGGSAGGVGAGAKIALADASLKAASPKKSSLEKQAAIADCAYDWLKQRNHLPNSLPDGDPPNPDWVMNKELTFTGVQDMKSFLQGMQQCLKGKGFDYFKMDTSNPHLVKLLSSKLSDVETDIGINTR